MNRYFEDNIKLEKVKLENDFWSLIDELKDDNSPFISNRNEILYAFRKGRLYSLKLVPTNSMLHRDDLEWIYSRNSLFLLPCFCIKNRNKAILLWVATRMRKKGLGTKLIKMLDIKSVNQPSADNIGFWQKMNLYP